MKPPFPPSFVIVGASLLLVAACASPGAPPPSTAPEPAPAAAPSAPIATETAPEEGTPKPRSTAEFQAELARRVSEIAGDREAHEREILERWMPSEPAPPPAPSGWRLEIRERGGLANVASATIVQADGTWLESRAVLGRAPEVRTGKLDAAMLARLAAFVASQRVEPRPARSGSATAKATTHAGKTHADTAVTMSTDQPERTVLVQEGKTLRQLRTEALHDEQWEPLQAISAATATLLRSGKANQRP